MTVFCVITAFMVHINMDVPEECVFPFRYPGSGYNISVKSVFFQLYLGPVSSTRKCRFPVDNNMIDMCVTNNIVK